MISLAPGEILFNDNDIAQSLYIIQKGQVRLFKPKGKGYIEIAVLRSGEVLGEMAYFDETGRRRSCSASAIVTTEVIEVSFPAFSKAIENLNPWFKTIITTLADRLRKTNIKVKELETNSMSGGYGGQGVAHYEFFRNIDVVKCLTIFFLVFKSHGEVKEGYYRVHRNTFNFYCFDVFNIQEVKAEEFLGIMKDLKYIKVINDDEGFPKILGAVDPQIFRNQLIFFNTERSLSDDKKLTISPKCEIFLARILKYLSENKPDKDAIPVPLNDILQEFKDRNVIIDEEDLEDAIKNGLVEEPVVGKSNDVTSVVWHKKLAKIFPSIQMMNMIKKVNASKSGDDKYS